MSASDRDDLEEPQSAEEAARDIGPFQPQRRAETFEPGGPTPATSPQRNLKNILRKRVPLKKNTYAYKDIDYHVEIRLLRVFHGKKEDPLACMLFPSALPLSKNAPSKPVNQCHPFSALSYWWGEPDEEPDYELIIYEDNGKHDGKQKMTHFNPSRKFYVRRNLFFALLQFRKTNKDINLWVDAICINQSNDPKALKEKTAQVARMDEIYSQSESVCVWLGEGMPETKDTFEFLRKILNLQNFDELLKSKRNPEKWHLLIKLMRNRWFSRRWVIQELALASEAVVHWGAEQMMWIDFADAIALAMTKHPEIKEILKQAAESSKMAKLDPTIHVDIPEPKALGANTLVNASSNLFRRSDDGRIQQRLVDLEVLVSSLFLPFEASEPRDTIYAVLSLAKDTVVSSDLVTRPSWVNTPETSRNMVYEIAALLLIWVCWIGVALHCVQQSTVLETSPEERSTDDRIAPNYDKYLTDVWADFMEYCIERSQSLDIICRHWAPPPRRPTLRQLAELQKSGREHEEESIPTWVPAIERHAYGGPSGILSGRKNGDSLVGSLDRLNQRCYNASGGLRPCVTFGKIKDIQRAQEQDQVEDDPTADTNKAGQDVPILYAPAAVPQKPSRKFDGTLHAKGFIVDKVEKSTGRVLDGVIPAEGLQFGGWVKDRRTGKFPTRVPDRLWRTLVADRGIDGMAAPTWYRRACRECLQYTNANDDLNTKDIKDPTPDAMKVFLERMRAVTWCRRFFLTEGREAKRPPLYGLGPRDTAPGDVICILFGCSVPVVLRKVRASDKYHFIGECYVHGMMDGEALPAKQSVIPEYPYECVDGFTIV